MELLKQSIFQAIDEESEELEELSKEIWQKPELNFEEHYAHEKLTNFLESKGFNVTQKFVLETGFKAEVGTGKNQPNIAIICEYDALPEIGHACGHNLIAEAGVAAGLGIKAAMEKMEKPCGRITVLGTPAEEGGGGKIDMIKAGVFDDIDVAMMVHPSPKTSSHVSLTAIDRVTVKYIGKAAHAAVYPWNGVNALDAAVLCYQTVSCLRQQMKPTWRVHGIIKNGGIKSNIIPDLSELEYSYRAPNKQELDQLKVKMRSCFDSAATGTGCQVSYDFSSKPYLNLVSNYRMADAFRSNAESLGVTFDAKEDEIGGSSDMGNVSQIVPSIHPLYNIDTIHGNHTKDFTTASGDPKAQLHTLNQAKAMALTCLDILTDENLLKEIRDEFAVFKQNSQ
ncbi:xaa-Arg dipeptidase-like [Mytilus trossulus]|uniref:xaa-Arg dipeptidase-like n=1 Tax=Mytilus trossulus TaxID=6551 RepID=UPI003003B39A